MDENSNQNNNKYSFGWCFTALIGVESFVVIVILCVIIVSKIFFMPLFSDIKKEYMKRFTIETRVSEVLEAEESD